MASGTIKIVMPEKGYGFITPDGSRGGWNSDVLFRKPIITEHRLEDFKPGDRVRFEQEPDPNYPIRFRATEIRRLRDTLELRSAQLDHHTGNDLVPLD